MLKPRFYQTEAVDAAINFFHWPKSKKGNGILICPTGSGKSVIITLTAMELRKLGKGIILQPSKEILQQNFTKFISNGGRAGIYSASAGMKYIDDITFCTIGSITKKHHLFKQFKWIIIDECHLVNPEDGMYFNLIKTLSHCRVLGLTATPYRLSASFEGAELRFITRTSPRIFNHVLYYIQNDVLFKSGFLAPIKYYPYEIIDRSKLEMNKSGTDFTDQSVKAQMKLVDMEGKMIDYANRILTKRNNLLVFCSLVSEAYSVSAGIPGSVVLHGEIEDKLRDSIISNFKKNIIRCVVVCGMLTTGFDKPDLEAVLNGKQMMSLATYYQIIGRLLRPFTYSDGTIKVGWFVDLGGNVRFFGHVETMRIEQNEKGLYYISNIVNGRYKQLTNVKFTKN